MEARITEARITEYADFISYDENLITGEYTLELGGQQMTKSEFNEKWVYIRTN